MSTSLQERRTVDHLYTSHMRGFVARSLSELILLVFPLLFELLLCCWMWPLQAINGQKQILKQWTTWPCSDSPKFWPIQIGFMSQQQKNTWNYLFANRIQATFGGGLKWDSNQISISSGLLRHNTAHNGDIKSKASEAHQCGCAESKLHHWVCLAWRGSCHDSTTVWRGRWWNSIFHGATHADSSVMSGHTNPIRLSAQSVLKTWFESERSLKDPLAFSHLLNVGWILAVWIKGDETVFFKLALFLFPLNSLLRLSTESKK